MVFLVADLFFNNIQPPLPDRPPVIIAHLGSFSRLALNINKITQTNNFRAARFAWYGRLKLDLAAQASRQLSSRYVPLSPFPWMFGLGVRSLVLV